MRERLSDQMLAAAKADFEPNFARRKWKQARPIKLRLRADFELRQ